VLRRLLIPSLLATGAILAGTVGFPVAHAQSDPMAVCRANTAAWAAAVATGDPAKIGALFAPDAVWVAPEGTLQGGQEITRSAEGWLKPGAKHVGTATAARQVGDVVLCSGEATYTFAPGGPAKELKSRWAEVLTRSGNEWRIEQVAHTYEPSPPPQPQAQARAR